MSAFKGVVATADYTFDKTAKTITFSANYTGIALSDIMYITNVKSATATVIYDPSSASLGGSLSSLVLTLAYDTSAMLSADPLQIIVAMGTLAAKVDASGVTLTVGSHAVTNAGTFAVQATPVTQADTFMLGGVNVKEINAVAPLMGSGVMGTGSLRVTIASDNDPLIVKQATAANLNATVVGTGTFVVQATLAAETTKVIGTVNVASSQTIAVTNTGTFAVQATIAASATNIAKAEDAAHSSADTGVFMLGVRNSGSATDSLLATFTNADIDYTPIAVDNNGALMLNWKNDLVTGTVTATGAAGFIYSEGYPTLVLDLSLPAGATVVFQLTTDGSVFLTASGVNIATGAIETGVSGAITNSRWAFNIAGFYAFRLNVTAYTSGTGNIRYSKNRSDNSFGLIPNRIRDSAGNLLTSNSTTYTAKFGLDANLLGTLGTAFSTAGKVDVKAADGDVFVRQATASNLNATVVGTGTFVVQATLAAETTKVIGVVRTSDGAGNLLTTNSTTYTAKFALDNNLLGTLGTAFSTAGKVDVKAADGDVFVRQATAGNLNATVVGTGTFATQPGGNVAHDAVDSGNPVKVGAKAIASLKTTTLVSGADRTDNQSDLDGALLVRDQFPLGDLLSERVTDTGGSSTAFSNFSAVASTRNFITAIVVYNSSATAGTVDFRDGIAGSVLWTMPVPAGGGSVLPMGSAPYFRTTANTALAYDVSGALSTIIISVSGFQSKL